MVVEGVDEHDEPTSLSIGGVARRVESELMACSIVWERAKLMYLVAFHDGEQGHGGEEDGWEGLGNANVVSRAQWLAAQVFERELCNASVHCCFWHQHFAPLGL